MLGGDLFELLKKAKDFKAIFEKKQEELGRVTVPVSAGGDMVKMTFNGRGEALTVEIDPQLLTPEKKNLLEDLILSCTNTAHKKIIELLRGEMSSLVGGDFSGMFR